MDIDIDTKTSFKATDVLQCVPASQVRAGHLVKHPCGHYFQNMPVDSHTGLAAIPYQAADQLGFFKIDFLHLSLLDDVASKAELRDLIKRTPDWSLLEDPAVVERLFQLGKHYELLKRVRPRSVQELADCIALIRPGKQHLIDAYVAARDRDMMRRELYKKVDAPYYKRSHAISYALMIVVQLHKIRPTVNTAFGM